MGRHLKLWQDNKICRPDILHKSGFLRTFRSRDVGLLVKVMVSEAAMTLTADGKADRKCAEITPFPQTACAVFSSRLMMS